MSFEHKAVVVATTSLMSRAAEMIITVTSRGGAVVVLHGGVVDAAGITLELQERGCGSLLRSGSVDFVHRSGGLVALDAAAVGVGSYSDQEPHLIVLHPLNRPVSSEHDLCGLPTDSPERSCLWSSHVCVFGSDYAATAGLTAVVGHLMVDMDGIEITLSNAEGRMLALDLLLDLLDDPAVVHQLAASPIMEKLERPALQRLVRRRLAALSASTTSSAPRRTTKSADFDSIQDAILRTDGQLDEMLEAGSPWLGSQVLVEDVHLRAVAWHPRHTRPSSLTDLLGGARLARLTERLEPAMPEIVRLGPPSAGAQLVMRVGVDKVLGYASVHDFNSSRTQLAIAKAWLRNMAPLIAAELRRRESWDRLRSESRGELITLLTQGLLSDPSARRALHVLIGSGGARVAAICPSARAARATPSNSVVDADPSPVMRHLDQLGVAYGEFQGLTVAVLNADEEAAAARLVSTLAVVPVAIGFGSVAENPDSLPISARQAAWTCRMAQAIGRRSLDFTGIGVHRLFLPGSEGGDPVFEEPIQRLEQHHDDLGFDGVQTLTGYLDSGASMRRAADVLVVHVNTLRYRLQRIAETIGVELGDPEQRFRLQLALRLRAGRRALQESGNPPIDPIGPA